MPRLILILSFIAVGIAKASPPLDTPISIPVGKIPHDCVFEISKSLSKEDDYAYSLAAGALLDSFRNTLPSGLSEEGEMAALRVLFDGLTPRQVILAGWPMRVFRAKVSFGENPLERDEIASEIETALMMVRKYSKGADQAREPVPLTRPSSS